MSDTPRTDEIKHNVADLAVWARKLERELAEAESMGHIGYMLGRYDKREGTHEPLHKQLKAARTSQGISLCALEQLSTVPEANLSRIENGKRSPTIATVEKICKALGVVLELKKQEYLDD